MAPEPSSATTRRNTATFTPMSTWVSSGRVCSDPMPWYTFCLPALAHSGQWKPTDAWCMHRGQIGRSQRWQITPANWSGWR